MTMASFMQLSCTCGSVESLFPTLSKDLGKILIPFLSKNLHL